LSRKPIHLAAHFPGVGSPVEFESFVHLARTAERGLFDFLLAEGPRGREYRDRIYDLDVVGRLDTCTVLAALAGVTDRIGLTGTIDTTFNEPFEVARQFATMDHLSDGRSGWNIVASSDAFTGANFRRGAFLDPADRYQRLEEFLIAARKFWDGWAPGAVLADAQDGVYVDPNGIRAVEYRGVHFDVRGFATLPAGPQGHPVLLHAGDSAEGRAFGARYADALFTLHASVQDGRHHYADVKGRAKDCGRDPNRLKVFAATAFVIGDTTDDAEDRARHIRYQQVSRAAAIAMLERVWGRDLSQYDPDGPLPAIDPIANSAAVVRQYRDRAQAQNLSIRELVIAVTSRQQFVGTPAHLAEEIDRYVQADACDGFILAPHGLDEFVDRVVPLLQERGAFRTEYAGHTLREHLG